MADPDPAIRREVSSSAVQAALSATAEPSYLRGVASPLVALAAAAAFALIATDVFAPAAPHLLPRLDYSLHKLVIDHFSPTFRLIVADQLVSDSFIVLGVGGWITVTIGFISAGAGGAALQLLTSWAFYLLGFGANLAGDPPVVDFIKKSFRRIRPSPVGDSFSFPSGHTTSAVFLIGALLFVLLPLAQRYLRRDKDAMDMRFNTPPLTGSLLLWLASAVTTGSGRIMADVHWFSDTVAASCLGVAAVSMLAMIVQRITYSRNK